MTTRMQHYGIDRLGESERLDLIEEIWDSLPDEIDPDALPDWHRTILDQRLDAAELKPGVGRPWRDVLGEG